MNEFGLIIPKIDHIPSWTETAELLEAYDEKPITQLSDEDLFFALSYVYKANHPTPLMSSGVIKFFSERSWMFLHYDYPFRRHPFHNASLSQSVRSSLNVEFRYDKGVVRVKEADYSDIPEKILTVNLFPESRAKILNDVLHGHLNRSFAEYD